MLRRIAELPDESFTVLSNFVDHVDNFEERTFRKKFINFMKVDGKFCENFNNFLRTVVSKRYVGKC